MCVVIELEYKFKYLYLVARSHGMLFGWFGSMTNGYPMCFCIKHLIVHIMCSQLPKWFQASTKPFYEAAAQLLAKNISIWYLYQSEILLICSLWNRYEHNSTTPLLFNSYNILKAIGLYMMFKPPSVLCNTFGFFSCNVFYVSIFPLRFQSVENKSWSGSISYILICI